MSIIIGSARHDESGRYSGGKAGDQKQRVNSSGYDMSGEVSTQTFYPHPKGWNIIRALDVNFANGLAFAMALACVNPNIGYAQDTRFGVIEKGILTQDPVNADCSTLVRACIQQCGRKVMNFTTANEMDVLLSSKLFTRAVYTDPSCLCNGDILVTKTKGHTAIVVAGARQRTVETTNCPFPEPSSTVRQKDKGDEVSWVQWQLNRHGANLEVDGVFGAKTTLAVKAFQKLHALKIDGVVGPATRARLKK